MGLDQLIGYAVLAVAGAVATAYTRWLSSSENKKTKEQIELIAEKLMHVELAEKQCQEQRKHGDAQLLVAMRENSMLRETLPREMVDGVKTLVTHAEIQTQKLSTIDAKANHLTKLEKWDSDPSNTFKRDLDEIKKLAVEQGHKIEDVEIVLKKMMQDREAKG